jgi:hypothetical protein
VYVWERGREGKIDRERGKEEERKREEERQREEERGERGREKEKACVLKPRTHHKVFLA